MYCKTALSTSSFTQCVEAITWCIGSLQYVWGKYVFELWRTNYWWKKVSPAYCYFKGIVYNYIYIGKSEDGGQTKW